MKPHHRNAESYAKGTLEFYKPALTDEANLAAAYLDLREKAEAYAYAQWGEREEKMEALREILKGE